MPTIGKFYRIRKETLANKLGLSFRAQDDGSLYWHGKNWAGTSVDVTLSDYESGTQAVYSSDNLYQIEEQTRKVVQYEM